VEEPTPEAEPHENNGHRALIDAGHAVSKPPPYC
jgi:hypothetical protein